MLVLVVELAGQNHKGNAQNKREYKSNEIYSEDRTDKKLRRKYISEEIASFNAAWNTMHKKKEAAMWKNMSTSPSL